MLYSILYNPSNVLHSQAIDILRQDKLILRNIINNNNHQNYPQLINIFQQCTKPLNKMYLYQANLKNLEIKLRKFLTTCRKNYKENQIKKFKQKSESIQCLSKAIGRARSKQSFKNNSNSSQNTNYFRAQDDPYVTTFGQYNKNRKLSTDTKENRKGWKQTTNNQSNKLYLLNNKSQKHSNQDWILDSQKTSKNEYSYKYNHNLIRDQNNQQRTIPQIKEDQIIKDVSSHQYSLKKPIRNNIQTQHNKNYIKVTDFNNLNQLKLPPFTQQQKFTNQKSDLSSKHHIESQHLILKQLKKKNQDTFLQEIQYEDKQAVFKTMQNDLLRLNQQNDNQNFISNRSSYQQSNIKIKKMLQETKRFIREYQQERNKTQINNTQYKKDLQDQNQKEVHSAKYNNKKQQYCNLEHIGRVTKSVNHYHLILPTYLQFSRENQFQTSFVQQKLTNYYLKSNQDLFTPPQLLQQCKDFLKQKNKCINLNSPSLVYKINEIEQYKSNIDNQLNYFHLLNKTEENPTQRRYNKFIQNKQLERQFISKQQTLCLTVKNTKEQYFLQNCIPKTKQQVLSYLFKQAQQSYLYSYVFLEKIQHFPQNLKCLLSNALINYKVQYLSIPPLLNTLPITKSLSRDLMTILDLDITHKSYIESSNIKMFLKNIRQAQIVDYYQIESLLWKVFGKAQSYHVENSKMLNYWHFYYLQMKQDKDFVQLCLKLGQFEFQIQLESLQVSQQ